MFLRHIQTVTAGSAVASISFSDIPQDGTDLYLVVSSRDDRATNFNDFALRFNGSTTGYSNRNLFGTGSSVSSNTSSPIAGVHNSASGTSNSFGNIGIYISNYTSSANKSVSIDSVGEINNSYSEQWLIAYLWSNTAAITSLSLVPNSANFVTGSSASLYKVIAGTDRTTTVS